MQQISRQMHSTYTQSAPELSKVDEFAKVQSVARAITRSLFLSFDQFAISFCLKGVWQTPVCDGKWNGSRPLNKQMLFDLAEIFVF